MRHKTLAYCLAVAGLSWMVSGNAATIVAGPNSVYSLNVTSYKQLAFRNIVRQQYDFSCGSAALATLLKYHYKYPVNEKQVFSAMFEKGDQNEIRRSGFSMGDMKRYLESLGMASDGYNVSLDDLAELGVPAIVLLNAGGYKHFVVITGIRQNSVLVSDPSIGAKIYPRGQFEKMWGKIAMLTTAREDVGKKYFNRPRDWKIVAKAPLRTAIPDASLSTWSLMMRGPTDF
ncbi:C39 family peptidase [Crenobacter cavernae]|uniref:Peptidase C39 n=1 Tax=Crenobacter cavernae TaxID=2290923 RepID=A0ABY0FII2_9NEIS|nr:C39 family peptidase [Crenobacter cavernae]RXZ45262.1 peptidase C39 [Crenobacter cavernae]